MGRPLRQFIVCFTTEQAGKNLQVFTTTRDLPESGANVGWKILPVPKGPWVGRLLNKDAVPARVRQIDFCDFIVFYHGSRCLLSR